MILILLAALDGAKAPNEFLLYPTGGHGYGLRSEKDVRDGEGRRVASQTHS